MSELATIEQLRAKIAQSGEDLKRSLTLQTLTPEQQYAYYQSDIATSTAQLKTAQTPADVDRLQQQILSDIHSAFNLLSPEQQQTLLPTFTKLIDSTDKAADNRLKELEKSIEKQFNSAIKDIQKVMDDVAKKMDKAANTQQTAANTNLTASRTPIRVVVTDPSGNEVGTYSGP